MWLDEARIHVASGRGGDGLISFHRSRHNPRGTPDGGDGGRGGDVILKATRSMNTLLHFQSQVHFRAEDGRPGGPGGRTGGRGRDCVILVPVGTLVRDLHSGEVLADLTEEGQQVVIARGGRGGRGNKAFTTSTRQAPRIRELGEPGEERWLKLELRVLADVGIVGFPNVGKSSLISRISKKKAKVAAYPFTTLVPNLGVVQVDEQRSFVVADLPGLVVGAHEGKGLGDRFLKHATRARVLLHLVDLAGVEGRDPLEDYFSLRREIEAWEELAGKPEVVAGNKVDLLSPEQVALEVRRFRRQGIQLRPISAVRGDGVRELVMALAEKLGEIPPEEGGGRPPRRVWRLTPPGSAFQVVKEGGVFVVKGERVERLVSRLDLSTRDAQEYLLERLERLGVMAALRRQGISPGDVVRIGEVELEYAE
ncbi:MAG: GTPase obg [Acetothermia bacterium 64_32]|nr:MAG: GTPase obg [Acetothermia bacterium 64_32]HAF70657.1 GTPase ObgE [Candidatus Acetothermia bacterium]